MISFAQIAWGLLLSTAIGGLAFWRRSLSASGWFGAVLTGTLTFGFGGWSFGLTLICFFITSSLLSHYKQRRKQQLAGEKFEKGGRRDLGQVLANGGIGAVLALLYGVFGQPLVLLGCYAGIMATVTADTWATELGVLSRGQPRSILGLQPVAPGTSGGVTLAGTLAGAAGAAMIGMLLLVLVRAEQSAWLPMLPFAATLGGVVGSLTDSLLGARLQAIYDEDGVGETERALGRNGRENRHIRGWRWMNNDAVNALSSLAGAFFAAFVLAISAR